MPGSNDDRDPLDGASDEDVDARFAAIVAEMGADATLLTGRWDPDRYPVGPDAGGEPGLGPASASPSAGPDAAPRPTPPPVPPDKVDERAQRREIRRAERAFEVAAFDEAKERADEQYAADTEHFVPPDPPPVPRPGRRTVTALVLLAIGILLLIWPDRFAVSPDLVRLLGLAGVLGGFTLLFLGLRARSADPQDGEGWDDGARL